MKTTIKISTTILVIAIIIFSCKKKDETPPPAAITTGATTGSTPAGSTFSAVVNGQNWSVYTDQFGPAVYLYNNNPNRAIGAQNANTTPYSVIKLNFLPVVGVFTLSQSGNYSATFTGTSNTIYTSKAGTINITSFDTSGVKSPYLDKIKCTFSFMTDTISSQSYTITNGNVDFIKN